MFTGGTCSAGSSTSTTGSRRDRIGVLDPHGVEMGRHDEFTLATNVPVYFCERASPWQRGTNENTNGLLRQYFPKSTDLGIHTAERLATVAADLNARPRKTLGWETPSLRLDRLLRSTA